MIPKTFHYIDGLKYKLYKSVGDRLEQWCPTKLSLSPLLSKFEMKNIVFVIRNPFPNICLSPHVANGDRVGHHWILIHIKTYTKYFFSDRTLFFGMSSSLVIHIVMCQGMFKSNSCCWLLQLLTFCCCCCCCGFYGFWPFKETSVCKILSQTFNLKYVSRLKFEICHC